MKAENGRAAAQAASTVLSAGLPLGVPASPGNERMLTVPPSEVAAFVHWSAIQSPNAASSNRTEQLLGHPEISEFLDYVRSNLRSAITATAGDDLKQVATINSITQLAEALLTHETAIYARFDSGPVGGLVCDLGDSAGPIKGLVDGFAKMGGETVTTAEVSGLTVHTLTDVPIRPMEFTVGKRYMILAVGEGEFESLLERFKQKQVADWLQAARRKAGVNRIANLSYVNIDHFDKHFDASGMLPRELQMAVQEGFRSATCVTAMDDDAVVVKSWFDADDQLQQTFANLFSPSKITVNDIRDISLDATVMMAMKVNLDALLTEILQGIDRVEPGSMEEFEREFRQEIGLDIRDDILSALDGHIQLYESPYEGGRLFTGWTAVLSIRDEGKVRGLQTKLKTLADNPRAPVKIKTRQYKGEQVSYMVFLDDGPGFTPAWCISKGRLIISTYPQCIYALLSRPPMPPAEQIVRAIEEQQASLFVKVREDRVAEVAYPMFNIFGSFLPAAFQNQFDGSIQFDPGMIPSLPAIKRHLGDTTITADFTDGVQFVRHQTLPPSALVAVAGIGAFAAIEDRMYIDDFDKVPPPEFTDAEDAHAAPVAMTEEPAELPNEVGEDPKAAMNVELPAETNDAKAVSQAEQQARQLALGTAKKFLSAGRRSDAIAHLEQFARTQKASSDNIEVRYLLGSLYYDAGKHGLAMSAFETCVESAPNDYRGYFGRGKTNWIQDRNDEALPDFIKATDLNPDVADPWLYLGLTHRSIGNKTESIVYLSQSLSLNSKQWYALYSRGNSYFDQGEYRKAISDYTDSLDLRARDNRSLYWRGHALQEAGELEKAISDMSEYLKQSPLSEEALMARADMYEDARKNVLAVRDYNAVIGLNPKNIAAFKGRGGVWLNLERYDEAIEDYTKVLLAKPDKYTYANRAICWDNKDEPDKVIADYTSALQLDPKYVYALKWRATEYMNTDQFSKAKADYAAAIDAGASDDSSVLGNFSWLLAACPSAEIRDGKLALEYATRGAEITNWKEAWIIDNVAAAHAELGDFGNAIQFAEKAMRVAQNDPEREGIQGRLDLYKQNKKAEWE